MRIVACDPGHPDALALMDELSAALASITGASGASSFAVEDARVARSLFVLAKADDGALLGCAALRPLYGEVGEVKRMFARPGTRGVGQALLRHIEAEASALGYAALWLETRRVNTRAVAFYCRHGYEPIANYGKYVGRAEAICLGKRLGGAPGGRVMGPNPHPLADFL